MWETWVQSLGWEDSLEKRKATHSSVLAWRRILEWVAIMCVCVCIHTDISLAIRLSMDIQIDCFHVVAIVN